MHQGGSINKNTVRVIRFVSLVLPVVLFLYALLVHYDVLAAERTVNTAVLYGLMSAWITVALFQFFSRSTSRHTSITYLILHHVFGALYILLVSGFAVPVVVSWIILLVAANGFFSRSGTYASAIVLTIAAAVDGFIHHDDPLVISSNAVAVIATLAISAIIIKLGYAQTIDSVELEKSKAQEMLQRDRMLTIVNNLADAVLSTDHEGVISVYNAASLNLLDTNDSLVGKHINDVLKLDGLDDEPVDLFASLADTHSVIVRDDLTLAQEGDEPLRLEVTYSPIRGSYSQSKDSESEDGYILILRDVTKAKSLEEERDEFISVVSHELRTPITIAEGTISNVLLMMEREDTMKDKLPGAIRTAHEQVIFLSKMVNDLSTLSRAERGVSDDKEKINVKQLATDLFHEYSPQAQKKDLRLDLDLDTHLGSVMESPLYLKELLQNFITNSIKYTKEGTVTLHVTRSDDDHVTFAVKDTGIGMSKTDQAKIFKKFYRSEDYRTRETGGTGLGLYVATKLARKLNTKILLESRLNYGSTFSFTLPIHKAKKTTK